MKRGIVRIVFKGIVALGLAGGAFQSAAQHVHLFSGAESQLQDSTLILVNRASYDTNSNGGITPECLFMSDGDPLYPSLYQSDATFVALPATLWTGGPAPNCAAKGAYIEAKMISVNGPEGGEIGFWQENEEATQTTKLFSLRTGTSNGTNRFNVSEGVTVPELDPFGHIHGRRFSANKPGLYVVGFQLLDTSTAGTNGGPIHRPSITNYFYFQAGNFINAMAKSNSAVSVRIGVRAFYNYELEANTNPATTNWTRVDGYIGSAHSHIQNLSDTNASVTACFYRLRAVSQ